MPALSENLLAIQTRIVTAAKNAKRDPASVRLLAVSKTFPAEDIAALRSLGQVEFGENRVQELESKVQALAGLDIVWHLIGHLQSNKAAKAAQLAHWIHSVDSEKLIRKLDQAATDHKVSILLELNLSGEESKSGFRGSEEDIRNLVKTALQTQNLELKGFMTMAAVEADDARIHATFAQLRDIRDKMEKEFNCRLPELSMGMSGDFPQAIAEGATIVRIGTAIFGHRDYPQT